jgi:hypothetical protein
MRKAVTSVGFAMSELGPLYPRKETIRCGTAAKLCADLT